MSAASENSESSKSFPAYQSSSGYGKQVDIPDQKEMKRIFYCNLIGNKLMLLSDY